MILHIRVMDTLLPVVKGFVEEYNRITGAFLGTEVLYHEDDTIFVQISGRDHDKKYSLCSYVYSYNGKNMVSPRVHYPSHVTIEDYKEAELLLKHMDNPKVGSCFVCGSSRGVRYVPEDEKGDIVSACPLHGWYYLWKMSELDEEWFWNIFYKYMTTNDGGINVHKIVSNDNRIIERVVSFLYHFGFVNDIVLGDAVEEILDKNLGGEPLVDEIIDISPYAKFGILVNGLPRCIFPVLVENYRTLQIPEIISEEYERENDVLMYLCSTMKGRDTYFISTDNPSRILVTSISEDLCRNLCPGDEIVASWKSFLSTMNDDSCPYQRVVMSDIRMETKWVDNPRYRAITKRG